jgi:Tfp pilus assembly protein PilF
MTKRRSSWCAPRPISKRRWTNIRSPPSAVLPARELLADLLLELNKPGAALVEYKEMLRTDPNRFRSILGEARAAKQSGGAAAARDAYQRLVALSKPAAPERAELAEAKAYLTS